MEIGLESAVRLAGGFELTKGVTPLPQPERCFPCILLKKVKLKKTCRGYRAPVKIIRRSLAGRSYFRRSRRWGPGPGPGATVPRQVSPATPRRLPLPPGEERRRLLPTRPEFASERGVEEIYQWLLRSVGRGDKASRRRQLAQLSGPLLFSPRAGADLPQPMEAGCLLGAVRGEAIREFFTTTRPSVRSAVIKSTMRFRK